MTLLQIRSHDRNRPDASVDHEAALALLDRLLAPPAV